jgi:hypothetical protein
MSSKGGWAPAALGESRRRNARAPKAQQAPWPIKPEQSAPETKTSGENISDEMLPEIRWQPPEIKE